MIKERMAGIADTNDEFRYLEQIADSVIENRLENALPTVTSMFSLLVAHGPELVDPLDIIVVNSPDRWVAPPGQVLIEHRTPTGRDESIVRPQDEAVALFWRFVIEKFGITPSAKSHDAVGPTG